MLQLVFSFLEEEMAPELAVVADDTVAAEETAGNILEYVFDIVSESSSVDERVEESGDVLLVNIGLLVNLVSEVSFLYLLGPLAVGLVAPWRCLRVSPCVVYLFQN